MFRSLPLRHHSACARHHATRALSLLLSTIVLIASFVAMFMPSASASDVKSVRQGYFYDLGSSTATEIAKQSNFLILPRGKSRLREEVRAAGFQGKVVQYFLSNQAGGPGPYANSSAACNTSYTPYVKNHVAFEPGDFCKYIHPNESWFLHNGRGERLYNSHPDGVSYHMNPASTGWRNFATGRMKRDLQGDSTQAKLGFDGLFLDNLHLKTYALRNQMRNSDGTVREYADSASYRTAVQGYLSQLSAAVRPTSVVWANLTDEHAVSVDNQMSYVQYLDGYMGEAWAVGYMGIPLNADRWNEALTVAERTQAQGKGVLTVIQGTQTDTTRQTYGLASYLLVTDGTRAFFRYADAAKYGQWWQYSNYNVALGAPKGPRYQIGTTWRRDFVCGYVTVDPAARTGQIVQQACGGTTPTATPQPTTAPTATPTPQPTTAPTASPAPTAIRLEAEDYKAGGQNIGYYDTTAGNTGGVYRKDDVDLQACTDGTNCINAGWFMTGEWLAYDVTIPAEGSYVFTGRVASTLTGRGFHIEVDGINVTGMMTVPQTGGWDTWTTITSAPVQLTAGPHAIRIVGDKDWFNLNYVTITRQ